MKHVGINAAINQSHRQEFIVQQGPDYIDAAFRIPIMLSEATLADRRVAMSLSHYSGLILKRDNSYHEQHRKCPFCIPRCSYF